ncbi:tetratricopeptide repeat protein [Candidatus Marinarcus aquaticus]|uniref:Tetratricopeptide repeat protein n=1 Tax=Candidatus Marinarcus aquaticus TaxID=2044504 RepID=A0A4Q0XNQ6_9BACT|nr:tetratricopeptide repeat protein [Candidatus Marinarcus aquaticus]RXJ54621.1 tetratricopeptide repeat protein [Candidatus Marinarcus aquaticus]
MDGLVLEYRDPLFGVIIFFTLIFVISFLTYSFGLYKEKKSRAEYRKLLQRFELGNLKEDDYVHLYTTYNLPFDSIILLASTFLHKGDYNKAIGVYLALLEHVTERVKKEELLELLGKTYFKGGFLQRSKEIFLKILKFSPRNKEALTHLLLIYEKLKEFEKASEVIESLEELDVDVVRENIYIGTLKLLNDPLISFDKKSNQLLVLFKMNRIIERLVVQYLLQFNKTLFWKNIHHFDISKILDLLWYLNFDDIDFDAVGQIAILQELYTAKGYINEVQNSSVFELDVIIMSRKAKSQFKIDLNFEFICTKCKSIHPIYESRCPHCHNILTFKIEPELTRRVIEANQSLQ